MVKNKLFSVNSISMFYFSYSFISTNYNNLSGFCCTIIIHISPALLSPGQLSSYYKLNKPITEERKSLSFSLQEVSLLAVRAFFSIF